jgi:serine/threonine protein kinase
VAGGMGVVYRAHDEHLDRDVALKILPAGMLADETARSRFRREGLTLSQLNHPNVAVVHDFDSDNGVDFLTMEYVEGETLAAKTAAGPLTEPEIINLGTQIAEALEEAHEHQIIHRDLKPANSMRVTNPRLLIGWRKPSRNTMAICLISSLCRSLTASTPSRASKRRFLTPQIVVAFSLSTVIFSAEASQRNHPCRPYRNSIGRW